MESSNHPEDKLNIYSGSESLPNASAVLTLGILSLVLFCCCGGFVGLVLSIIAVVLGNKSMRLYESNPNNYASSSFNNVKAGRICAIVGLILNGVMILFTIIRLIFYESFFSPNDIWDQFR
jgi:M penetrans paralogue family 26